MTMAPARFRNSPRGSTSSQSISATADHLKGSTIVRHLRCVLSGWLSALQEAWSDGVTCWKERKSRVT